MNMGPQKISMMLLFFRITLTAQSKVAARKIAPPAINQDSNILPLPNSLQFWPPGIHTALFGNKMIQIKTNYSFVTHGGRYFNTKYNFHVENGSCDHKFLIFKTEIIDP
jgi:hypothetical protein